VRLGGGAAAVLAGGRLPVIAQDSHQGALVAAAGRSLGHHCIHCLAHRRARRLRWGRERACLAREARHNTVQQSASLAEVVQ